MRVFEGKESLWVPGFCSNASESDFSRLIGSKENYLSRENGIKGNYLNRKSIETKNENVTYKPSNTTVNSNDLKKNNKINVLQLEIITNKTYTSDYNTITVSNCNELEINTSDYDEVTKSDYNELTNKCKKSEKKSKFLSQIDCKRTKLCAFLSWPKLQRNTRARKHNYEWISWQWIILLTFIFFLSFRGAECRRYKGPKWW